MELVSIVTVVKDAEKTLKTTIGSILSQTYHEIECIFIDVQSRDLTNEIIEEYRELLENRDIRVIHIVEPDEGIYDAMNKAIKYVHGEWVLFLNANDWLCDEYVLENVFTGNGFDGVDCLYGDSINIVDGIGFERKAMPMESIFYRVPFIYQALFLRSNIIKKYKFDCDWKLAADYDQILRMYLDNVHFEHIDIKIANFDLSGVSQRHSFEYALEREKIQKKYNAASKRRFRRYLRTAMVILIKENKSFYKTYIRVKNILNH